MIQLFMLEVEKSEKEEEKKKKKNRYFMHQVFIFCKSWYKNFLHKIFYQHCHFLSAQQRLFNMEGWSWLQKWTWKNLRKLMWMMLQKKVSNSFRITITLSQKMKLRNILFYRLLTKTVKNIQTAIKSSLQKRWCSMFSVH